MLSCLIIQNIFTLFSIIALGIMQRIGEADKVGFRLNGVSDYAWEDFSVKLTKEDITILKRHLIFILNIRYGSVIEAVQKAIDLNNNELLKNSVQFYDYTKRIDRNFSKAKALNYHIKKKPRFKT